jgi:hypothetical protein
VTLLGASLGFSTGCATGGAQRHGIPAGEWQARLPTSRSPIDELAYGRGGSGTPAQLGSDELAALASPAPDDVLQPAAAAKVVAVHKPAARRPQLAAAKVEQPVSAAPEPAPAPIVTESPAAPLLASNDVGVEQRYAQRDQQASDQKQFRGGDAIVITAGALVVILLIVILILLLR